MKTGPVHLALLALFLWGVSPLRTSQGQESPGEVVLLALRAVETGDGSVRAEWGRRVREDPGDRVAALGLATLAWLAYHYDEAEALLGDLLGGDDASDSVTPYAWLSLGSAHQARGMLRDADHAFSRALETSRELRDTRAEAWSLMRLGNVRGRLEGPEAFQRYVEAAEALMDPDDAFLLAQFHCIRAGADPRGRYTLQQDAEAGAAWAARIGVERFRASCLHTRATGFIQSGEMWRALELFDEAQESQRRARDRAGRAAVLQWAGYGLVSLGSYGPAQSYLEEAIVEGEASGNLSPVAWAYMNLAAISLNLGDLVTARLHAARAEDLLREQGDRTGLTTIIRQKGDIAFAAGDFAGARRFWGETMDWYLRDRQLDGVYGIQTSLVKLALAEDDLPAAERLLALAEATGREAGMDGWILGLRFLEAEIALVKGEFQRAEDALQAYLARGQYAVRAYRARVRLAEVYARTGEADRAHSELEGAMRSLESWREGLDAAALRRYAFQIAEYAHDPDLGVATILAAMVEAGKVPESFELAERQRARDLFEGMIRADAARTGMALRAEDGGYPSTAALHSSAQDLWNAFPNDGTALLQFVTGVGGEPTTLFVVWPGGIRAEILPPMDSLRGDVDRFLSLVSSGGDPEAVANRLGRELLAPALRHLPPGVTHLVVVPDGPLHRVPFDALVEGGERVVERFAVSLAPSATVLVRLWERAPTRRGSTLLAMGDPALPRGPGSGSSDPDLTRLALPHAQEFPPLPGSAREARAVSRFAREGVARIGRAASEAYVKTHPLDRFSILHFASHATVDDATLARTALVLSPGEGEDGFLSPGEIARLDLEADLVVLSACRTAGGTVVRGEGIQGLTAPLLEAGARAVVATGWEIDDRSSRRFVEDFYRALARGETVTDALRWAKLEALGRGESMAQWAAFTLVGDPMVVVELTEPRRRGVAMGAVAAMALLVGLAWMGLRRRSLRGAGG